MRTEITHGDPRSLKLLDTNARFMAHEQFAALVANIRRDGKLTSVPFVWHDQVSGTLEVLSGNHRVKAAVEAGLTEISWMQTSDPLTRQQRIAIQLSHNAIAGQDDPSLLKALYDELQDVDWRAYSGLDDKTLALLEKVELDSLSEANLDFATVQILFLPHELESAKRALADAASAARYDERWLAPMPLYEPVLDALATSHDAHAVGNVTTALLALLALVEAHLDELRQAWFDPQAGLPKRRGQVPLETLFATRTVPSDAGAVIAQAIDRLVAAGDVDASARWRALELWAADYLAGVG
jgi:hypothetical protein